MNKKRKRRPYAPEVYAFSYHFWLMAAYTMTAIPCVFMADALIEDDLLAFVLGIALTWALVGLSMSAQVAHYEMRGVDVLVGGDDDTAG